MTELFPKFERCALCGSEARDVTTSLVRYAEPDAEGNRFGRLPRCRDHEACRSRVAASGETWILADREETLA